MVMVQDRASSKFDGMPASAIATGLADYILPPNQMPQELLKYVKHPVISAAPRTEDTLATQEDSLSRIINLLGKQTGVDFTYYKPTTVVRRIEQRMGIAQVATMVDYLHYLYQSPQEVTSLYKDLLIGVTKYFRDSEAFGLLEKRVIPELFNRKRNERRLRVWVAGCATGEEAYSIAILLKERQEMIGLPFDLKVFATDIDQNAIDTASLGIYPGSILGEMSENRLQRFFIERGGQYQVSREIREMVVFAPQNLLKDPPFTKIDLVSCRNLLIYLQPILQQRILGLFAFAIQEGGYLLLGSSETVGELSPVFEVVDSKWKLFERVAGVSAPIDKNLHLTPARERLLRTHFGAGGLRDHRISNLENRVIEDIVTRLVDEYAPASFVIDENANLQHSFGNMPEYVRLPQGQVTLNLVKMLPKELSLALSTAIHRTMKERGPVQYHSIRFQYGQTQHVVNLKVEPLPETTARQLLLLVCIMRASLSLHEPGAVAAYDPEKDVSQRITDLEQELQMSRENLQATVEELETSNEELQATNEELLAANEELQSTNEELQSVNEELYTVNAEYQNKITELTELNNDIDHLLTTSEIGTIFLDSTLRIRKFTSAIAREVNLLPHDIGRPLAELAHPLLKAALEHVSQALTGKSIDHTVRQENGKWFLIRIIPYVSRDSTQGTTGVVVTIINVTPLKIAEDELRKAHESLEEKVRQRTVELTKAMQAISAANRAKNEFLTNMSYEIRSPLNSVMGILELLKIGTLSLEEQATQVHLAQQRGQDLLDMMTNLLELARLEGDAVVLTDGAFALESVTKAVLDAALPVAKRKGLTCTLRIADDVPRELSGDAAGLRQVLSHLLNNALKFTEQGSVALSVELEGEPHARQICFRVRDTGIGIAEEHLSVIFEPFTQVDGSHSRAHDGAGLGLAISRQLVERMGGRLDVESRLGQGSCFFFTLPLRPASKPADLSADVLNADSLQDVRVLLVDDDQHSRYIVGAMLRSLGCLCTEVGRAEDVLQMPGLAEFDVMLLDVQMPGISGLELAARLRERVRSEPESTALSSVPMIALTSHAMKYDELRCREAGMDAFLAKPVTRAQLGETIRRLLAAKRRHDTT